MTTIVSQFPTAKSKQKLNLHGYALGADKLGNPYGVSALTNETTPTGGKFRLKRFGDSRSVIAKDGRGEVLRLRGRWVEQVSLEDNDVQRWQQAQENRIKQSQQQQLSPLPKPKKSSPKAKRKKQIELDRWVLLLI